MTVRSPEEFPPLRYLEEEASRKVLEQVWAYVEGGAAEERTLRANLAAFLEWDIRPRMLTGASAIDTNAALLGQAVSAPFFVSPMAYQAQVHPEGELGVARAGQEERILTVFSTLSSFGIEEIARAAGTGPRWFQLYLQPDFEVSRGLVRRAEAEGYSAVVVTVDAPVLGVRDRQARGGFAIDSSVPIGSGPDVVPPPRAPILQGTSWRLRSEAESGWDVLDQVRSATRLPVVVKGILTAEDARLAVEHGAGAIVVSNHGGRQLDGTVASLDALPEVVDAVGSRAEVYLDGGVRRGTDILVALALGANAVGIGRPVLWALAFDGGRGVRNYFSLLKTELATALALAGRDSIHHLDRALLSRQVR